MTWVLLGAATVFFAANLWLVTEIRTAQQQAEQVCREELAKELRWKPWAQGLRLPPDPCQAVRTTRRGP